MVNEVIYSDLEDSDVKLGGREMTMVIHSNEEGSICSPVIDGEEYVEDEARKYWNEPIRYKLYMETKKDVIEKRSKEVGDGHLHKGKSKAPYQRSCGNQNQR